MFGLGIGEVLLILVVVLLIFGPHRLPDLARMMGKAMGEFRRASRELRETFEVEMREMEREPGRQPPSGARPRLPASGVEAGSPEERALDAELEEEAPERPAASSGSEDSAARHPAPAGEQTAPPPEGER